MLVGVDPISFQLLTFTHQHFNTSAHDAWVNPGLEPCSLEPQSGVLPDKLDPPLMTHNCNDRMAANDPQSARDPIRTNTYTVPNRALWPLSYSCIISGDDEIRTRNLRIDNPLLYH